MHTRLATAFAAVILAACALVPGYGLKPGVSTEREVRGSLGVPAMEYADTGGGRILAYTTGPMGTQTYMATLSADGRLVRLEQVLSEDQFQRIERGKTTSAQLERLIGPPWRKVAFPNLRQVAWDYVYRDAWGYTVDFSVMVDEGGFAVGTVNARREPGGDTRR